MQSIRGDARVGHARVRRAGALILVSALALPTAAGAQSHPHLLWSAADVPALQARAASTHQPIWAALKGGTDYFLASSVAADGTVTWPDGHTLPLGDVRDIGNALEVFAFVWQIDGGSGYWDLAHRWLTTVAGWGSLDLDGTADLVQAHLLAGVAFAYDVLYPGLADAERATVRQVLASNATSLMQGGLSGAGTWWEHEYLQNHNWINHDAVGLAALAIEGEVAGTDAWRGYATANAKAILDATSGIVDGSWHEGAGYLDYGLLFHLPFLEALRRAGHEDLREMPLLRGLAGLRAHAQIPEQPAASVLPYGDFYGIGRTDGLMPLRWAASRYGDGLAQAAADREAAAGRGSYAPEINDQVLEFLFYDPAIPAADLAGEPLDWFGSDLQAAIFRSSWTGGGTLVALKAGSYGGRSAWQRYGLGDPSIGTLNFGHDHADDNGFYLYGNGTWLAPEVAGYGAGNANGSELHNVLLVDGQGQLVEQGLVDEAQAYSWFGSREGVVSFHGSSEHFGYSVGSGEKLYPESLGLSRWDRHLLFLDRQVVVLRDVVEATQPHAFAWLCHFLDGASQDGSWIQGLAKNGQALGVAVVGPASWTFSATTQTAPRFGAQNGIDPDGTAYAATVTAPAAASTTFLTALVPVAAAAWSGRPAVSPLDPDARDAGLSLVDGQRIAAAIFGDASGSRRAAGYHLEGLAGVAESLAGAPTRALLVAGRILEDATRALLAQDGTASVLEADGLSGSVVSLSGDALGSATIWAPGASRVLWRGVDIPFERRGDLVAVQGPGGGATAGGGGAGGAGGTVASGCSVGGRAGVGAVAVAAIALVRRRRRRLRVE